MRWVRIKEERSEGVDVEITPGSGRTQHFAAGEVVGLRPDVAERLIQEGKAMPWDRARDGNPSAARAAEKSSGSRRKGARAVTDGDVGNDDQVVH